MELGSKYFCNLKIVSTLHCYGNSGYVKCCSIFVHVFLKLLLKCTVNKNDSVTVSYLLHTVWNSIKKSHLKIYLNFHAKNLYQIHFWCENSNIKKIDRRTRKMSFLAWKFKWDNFDDFHTLWKKGGKGK